MPLYSVYETVSSLLPQNFQIKFPTQKPLINPQLHRYLNTTFPRQPLPSAAVFSEKVSRRRKNISPDSMFVQWR